jgi:glucose 1-dehydrogenase
MLMMKTLAQEFARERVRVNGIAPGAIKTKINEDVWSDPERSKELLKLIPYGRIGEPEDVARAAVWLASDEADYLCGATLFIDGGHESPSGIQGRRLSAMNAGPIGANLISGEAANRSAITP